MARTKPTVAEAAAKARREFDAALAAAAAETRRKALMANVRGKMATAAGRREALAASLRNDGGSISSLSEAAPPRPPSGSPPAAAAPSPDQYSPASGEILCRYGARCYRPDCKFKHPTAYVAHSAGVSRRLALHAERLRLHPPAWRARYGKAALRAAPRAFGWGRSRHTGDTAPCP